MGHRLDGAFLRLERADRHLEEAAQLVCKWEAATKDKIVREDNGQYRFNGFTIAITLPKRGEIPLMPTLTQLQGAVHGILESFRREF